MVTEGIDANNGLGTPEKGKKREVTFCTTCLIGRPHDLPLMSICHPYL